MRPTQIYLTDRNEPLCSAWKDTFAGIDEVSVHQDDFFARDADAMVSPANSFGIMDGGLDLAIQSTLKGNVQAAVQDAVLEKHHGEMPVGYAEIVRTEDERWPFLIAAPTMRIPEDVSFSINAYYAFRAVLVAIMRHNESSGVVDIDSVIVPGFATGVGRMDPNKCAVQMRVAYNSISSPPRIPSHNAIRESHSKLRGWE